MSLNDWFHAFVVYSIDLRLIDAIESTVWIFFRKRCGGGKKNSFSLVFPRQIPTISKIHAQLISNRSTLYTLDSQCTSDTAGNSAYSGPRFPDWANGQPRRSVFSCFWIGVRVGIVVAHSNPSFKKRNKKNNVFLIYSHISHTPSAWIYLRSGGRFLHFGLKCLRLECVVVIVVHSNWKYQVAVMVD